MSRRSAVLTAVAWVLVVSVGATAVWWVISRAGGGVAGELPVTTAAVSAPDTSSGAPLVTASAPDPNAGPVTRSWRGTAGTVVASCSGASAALVSAKPSSGWKVEVDSTGPDLVRVEYETADERGRVRVEAVCRDGAPAFTADNRDED